MTTKNQIITSRRDALKSIPLAASAVAIAASSVRAADVTPSQTAGPFYPDLNNDLTFVTSREHPAKGDIIYVHGVVRDTNGKPVSRALVEFWQTDHQGIYDHAGDERQADKDPNFQSFGRYITDDDGKYFFKTIRPRWYGDEKFMRTPHIHCKVWRRGFHELTSQMYFESEAMNAKDGLYNKLNAAEQKLVTVAFPPSSESDDRTKAALALAVDEKSIAAESKVGHFDITIKAV
ncbi:MAG: hypothetical protein HOI66_01465 [Verrucomicrobia bacterium]|jgi:protocatechuate 3,4-dioxygenase, beta subunit|nr:hypothetical protein [Verrucomicrobiota bacterium]